MTLLLCWPLEQPSEGLVVVAERLEALGRTSLQIFADASRARP
jgi:hypothetical protein